LTAHWSRIASDSACSKNSSTVSGDRVYVVAGATLYGQTAATGQSTWAFGTTSSFEHVLPVGNLVVIGNSLSNGDQLIGLDQSTGLRRWGRTTSEVPLAFAGGTDDGMDSPLLLTGTSGIGPGRLVGRDPTDGSLRWRTPTDPELFSAFVTPALGRGRVYAGGSPLTAFDAADGTVRWLVRAGRECHDRGDTYQGSESPLQRMHEHDLGLNRCTKPTGTLRGRQGTRERGVTRQ